MTHIFLYGPPGSGKSTIGKSLAASLDLPYVDLDQFIEETAGKSILQIMEGGGEPGFRDLESTSLRQLILEPASVIALGGGALLREENRFFAESAGKVVFLDADSDSILKRLRDDPDQRPLLTGDKEEKLKALMLRRADHYASFKLRIATIGHLPEQISGEIQKALGRFRVSWDGGWLRYTRV